MILDSRFAPSFTKRSVFVIALPAFLVLPLFIQTTKRMARAASNDVPAAPAASNPGESAASDFPYMLKFEQGPTRFEDGDEIKILEVRGTADAMTPATFTASRGRILSLHTIGPRWLPTSLRRTRSMEEALR